MTDDSLHAQTAESVDEAGESGEHYVASEAGSDVVVTPAEPAAVEARKPGWLARLRNWLWPSAEANRRALMDELAEYDEMIALHPEAPMNYVLRGELYEKIGYDELAVHDFEFGLELARKVIEGDSWGVVAQIAQDRAQQGLTRVKARPTGSANAHGDDRPAELSADEIEG